VSSSWHRYGVRLPGYGVLAISSAEIVGWLIKLEIFKRLVSSFAESRPATAAGFLFFAVSLLLLDRTHRPLRAISCICALCAVLIGAFASLEYLTQAGTSQLGRMSLVTATSLILLGFAILLLDFRWGGVSLSSVLTWISTGLSFLTLTGYAYDPVGLLQLRMFSGVSLLSPLMFLLICTAILFARPERGVAAILLNRDLGGQTARRLLPVAIFIPFTVSLLIFKLYQAGAYGAALMVVLFVVAPVLIFVPLILLNASLLNRIERERKQSAQELSVSTQRFSSVVASAMDAIITLDESQRVIVFNGAAEKMFGCPSGDVLGKPLDRFLPEQFREVHSEHIRKFGETGLTTRSITSPGILSAVRANGESFPIEATVSQVQVAGQKLYTVILRDITRRLRAEETLRHSEARFRSLYEQAAIGIAQVAFDGQLLMVNAALCRMLGYEESELRGKNISDVTHPDDRARQDELIAQRKSYQLEKRCLHRDGTEVWVDVSSSLVSDSTGAPLYRISVIQNITGRKCAEEQLAQAQKLEAIGRLAGGVAHDFNTLLNVMLGYSELLLKELPAGDSRREKVIQIKNSSDAGALLTRQLLAFSRKQSVAREVLDLREVASRMMPILSRLLPHDIELTVKCPDELCRVKVDPGQIQQLMLNLVANAGDAMPDGGQVNIEVQSVKVDEAYVQQHPALQVGGYAVLSISDSGLGMDAETVSHIFEPFFTTKEKGKGTGLGLATVYGIAKQNGGDIWVYSELGAGTVFKVYLPLTTEALQEPGSARVSNRTVGGETILLVEDSAALRELTKVILMREGYNILEAEDGVAAMEVSTSYEGKIHLVLTDVVMPRMRGPQLAELIVKQRPEIAVVFLSGYTEEAISQSDGISGYALVEKPYTAEVLLHSIRRALNGMLVTRKTQ
jgi:PAS domain S-box-containing protein